MQKGIRLYWLILVLVLPVIVAGTIGISALIKIQFEDHINESFDQKLIGISSLVTAFLDGKEHQALYPQRDITYISYDAHMNRLLGIDQANNALVEIAEDGSAENLSPLPDLVYRGLEADSNGAVWILVDAPRSLARVNPDNGEFEFIQSTGVSEWKGLIKHPMTSSIYGFSDMLEAVPEATLSSEFSEYPWDVLKYPFFFDRNSSFLGYDTEGQVWLSNSKFPRLSPIDVDFMGDLASDGTSVWIAADTLGLMDINTFQIDFEPFVPGYFRSRSDFYKSQVEVFFRIRERTGLSYLYSLIITGKESLRYILDGSTPEEFTPIGYQDSIPETNFIPLTTAELSLRTEVRPVEEWENWGLIKSVFSPVIVGPGQAEGLIGADFKVDVIEEKVKQANYASILTAVLGIVIALVVTLFAAKSLLRPLSRLKEYIVGVAGGTFTEQTPSFAVYEFQQSADAVSRIQVQLEESERLNDQRYAQYEEKVVSIATLQELAEKFDSHLGGVNEKLFAVSDSGHRVLGGHQIGLRMVFFHANMLAVNRGQNDFESMKRLSQWRVIFPSLARRPLDEIARALNRFGLNEQLSLFEIDFETGIFAYHLKDKDQLSIQVDSSRDFVQTTGSIELENKHYHVSLNGASETLARKDEGQSSTLLIDFLVP